MQFRRIRSATAEGEGIGAESVSFEHLQKSCGKGLVPLLCEVYAVISQGNVPRSGIGKADAHLLCQGLTELGEGMGVINELLIGNPCPQGYRRRCNQEDLLSVQGDAGEESLQPFSGLAPGSGPGADR